jgi:5-(carboxyamino)imidazole ribonucleotide synthase
MLALAGYPLGLKFRFLDETRGPAADVADWRLASFSDNDALDRFADGVDLVTYEFENVPVSAAAHLASRLPLFPPPRALSVSQDRLAEKDFLSSLGIATASYTAVRSREELEAAAGRLGPSCVVKTVRHGYDGRGQVVLRQPADAAKAWDMLGRTGRTLICEQLVPFTRELSVVAACGHGGKMAVYPLVENEHRAGILFSTVAPAKSVSEALTADAHSIARRVCAALEYVGVLAIELFDCNGTLVANEIAPRVHNSGHWTIDGAETSQFENHLRAVAGWPLGGAAAALPSRMLNFIGEVPPLTPLLEIAGAHIHLYGKEARPGRKLGHVTVCGVDEEDADRLFRKAAQMVGAPVLAARS